MIRHILVPLDGSVLAETILPEVEVLVRLMGARLTLLRVLEPLSFRAELAEIVEAERLGVGLDDRRLAAATQALDTIADGLKARGIEVDRLVVEGLAADLIIEHGRMVDLIAMATHGRSGIGRWVYGSVADRVLRAATVPVLLLPALDGQRPTAEAPRRILVPLDGSTRAERALPLATQIAERSGGLIVLTHCINWFATVSMVVPDSGAILAADEAFEIADNLAQAYINRIADRLTATGLTVITDVRKDSPYQAIVAAAREHQVDLIVMSSHGRGGLRRAMLGSVAERVLQDAGLPMLLVRAGVGVEGAVPTAKA